MCTRPNCENLTDKLEIEKLFNASPLLSDGRSGLKAFSVKDTPHNTGVLLSIWVRRLTFLLSEKKENILSVKRAKMWEAEYDLKVAELKKLG